MGVNCMRGTQKLRRFVDHPVTRLTMGLILFSTGFAEAYQSLSHDLAHLEVGAHHGVMIFGLFSMFSSLPDLIEGVGTSVEYLEHLQEHGGGGRRE